MSDNDKPKKRIRRRRPSAGFAVGDRVLATWEVEMPRSPRDDWGGGSARTVREEVTVLDVCRTPEGIVEYLVRTRNCYRMPLPPEQLLALVEQAPAKKQEDP